MKALLINDNDSRRGGAERYFFTLIEKLQRVEGVQVNYLCFGEQGAAGKDFLILPAARSNMAKLLWRCLFHPIIYSKVRRYVRKIAPDIIHVHNIKQYPVSVLKAIKGYKVIHTTHDFSLLCPTAQNIHRDGQVCSTGVTTKCLWQHQVKYNKLVYLALTYGFLRLRMLLREQTEMFFAPSPLLAAYLDKNKFQPAHYIAPFIKPAAIVSAMPESKQFLFAGNLGAHKGISLLLREFARACETDPTLRLVIAGSGPEETLLRTTVKQPQVDFVGWQEDLTPFYQQSRAVIFPSTGLEAFGLVMTEAMGSGRPVIAINRGTAAWLVKDKETGLLFDPQREGDLAEMILKLAEDKTYAETLGAKARADIAQRFNDDVMLKRILQLYRQLHNRSRSCA